MEKEDKGTDLNGVDSSKQTPPVDRNRFTSSHKTERKTPAPEGILKGYERKAQQKIRPTRSHGYLLTKAGGMMEHCRSSQTLYITVWFPRESLNQSLLFLVTKCDLSGHLHGVTMWFPWRALNQATLFLVTKCNLTNDLHGVSLTSA